jgi:hypothetical protein
MQELVEVGRPHKPEKDNCVTLPHECVSQCESPHTMLYAVIKIFRRRVTKVEFRFYNRSRLYNSEEMIPHHTYIINENVRMLGRIQLDSTVTYLREMDAWWRCAHSRHRLQPLSSNLRRDT